MDRESSCGGARARKKSWRSELLLAYQSLGVVYGEVATSPLYVYKSAFAGGDIDHTEGNAEIYGVLSLVFWTLTLITLLKYVLIVLRADDAGEGGTFALYSLLRQHVNFKQAGTPVPVTRLDSDANLSFHGRRKGARGLPSRLHEWLEGSSALQSAVTCFVLFGTCMMIGDGALTPAISVLSAVQGIESRSSKITQDHIVILSVVILVLLFLIQRFGTSKGIYRATHWCRFWAGLQRDEEDRSILKNACSSLEEVGKLFTQYGWLSRSRIA